MNSTPRDQKAPVDPVLPVAPYQGGKRNLARRIVPLIDADPHRTYTEAFVGMGGIFFRRTRQPSAEFINDYSGDVATLFRILQRHYPQFLETLRFTLTTRAEFDRLSRTDPATLTDLERAARFLYLQRTAFGGGVGRRTFGIAKERPARFNLSTVEPLLEDVHTRLSRVTIECLDFAAFLTRTDSPDALHYLDPPYHGTEGCYGKDLFQRADFERLNGVLKGLQGHFIVSINDTPEIRDTFAGFDMREVTTTYSVARKGEAGGQRAELLISNFALPGGT